MPIRGATSPESRSVFANNAEANDYFKYPGNSIRTTKYTLVTFLPKGFYEQFRKVANLYFLLIAALSLTPISPVSPITNVVPLVFVLAVSLTKEAFEDRKRRIKDSEINGSTVEALRDGGIHDVAWRDIKVGDIVKVYDRKYFPADLVLLSSANPEGVCYIETMNLDGETNLKIKKALKDTWSFEAHAPMSTAKLQIECEQPNHSLYTFTGNLILNGHTHSLSPNQVLLRGCVLRNTPSVLGVVVFTGHQTKVMMNATAAPSKRSTLERQLDWLILFMFCLLAALCLVGSVGSALWVDKKYWYLNLGVTSEPSRTRPLFDPGHPVLVGALNFLTLITLYSTLIPISLYVSIEIIKYFQAAKFINNDRSMYHKASDTPALARTSNLNEELGQIQYIFSDKTGTLTCNQMDFFKCSIAGVRYGRGVTEIQKSMSLRQGIVLKDEEEGDDGGAVSVPHHTEPGFVFHDNRLMGGHWVNQKAAPIVKEFFKLLAICHTVICEGDPSPDTIRYQAASPDEAALVVAAKVFGFFFWKRTPNSVVVSEPEAGSDDVDLEYEILAVLEFNSTRKRQSVIVRQPDGSIVLYCKGADNVIYDRLSPDGKQFWSSTVTHLEEFGNQGLRTLCLAYRILPKAEYDAWEVSFSKAKTSLHSRDVKLDDAAEMIEVDLILLGATAIEDKLQAGVPGCIEQLANAGIKIWVLTGDKLETAINIGYACSLLNNEQRRIVISSETPAILAAEQEGYKEVDRVLRIECKAVVCCRVSPLQKALVTRLVREGAGQITLAIGDGANDVSMIQAAHVGVGISGQEGMQAVMAADFAIAQFKFLTDLLLVHGRWSYKRVSQVIGYFFYKNTVYTLTQFWFNLYAAYSGQRFYDDWYQSFYNLLFTSLPVIVVGLLDQDVSKASSVAVPQLYIAGQRNDWFSKRCLASWLVSAVWQSLVCFYVTVWTVTVGAGASDGKMLSLWETGTLAYTLVVFTVNLRLLMSISFHTTFHYLVIFGSIGVYAVFILLYCRVAPSSASNVTNFYNVYYTIYALLYKPAFYLAMLLGLAASLLPDLALQGCRRAFWTHDFQIIQEDERKTRMNRGSMGSTDVRAKLRGYAGSAKLAAAEALERVARSSSSIRSIMPRPLQKPAAHTGYAFDHPGFESFYADEAERELAQEAASLRVSREESRLGIPQRKVPTARRYTASEAMMLAATAQATAEVDGGPCKTRPSICSSLPDPEPRDEL
ncbi:hypothetical protein WJX72_004072 [[Myrmecia] bisecta]|uniref:Phospholipid-transporting ATPase n=1 Tax=[Myrmecia] bisecta TaxID=41462 RepID=A0AAW1PXM2_9CHLO